MPEIPQHLKTWWLQDAFAPDTVTRVSPFTSITTFPLLCSFVLILAIEIVKAGILAHHVFFPPTVKAPVASSYNATPIQCGSGCKAGSKPHV